MYRELEHHGILGMKWGVRRYQNEDGTLTTAGKERYSKSRDAQDKEYKKFAKQTQKIKQDQAKDKKKAEKQETKEARAALRKVKREQAEREKILSDPDLLKKNYKRFSDEEVQRAIRNFETEKRLSDISQNKLRKAENWLGTMAKMTASAIVVYNNSAKAYNTFLQKDNPLPIIKGDEKQKKKGDE